MMKPKLLVIIGPTASGKTALGIKLAKQRDGAVISADSRQLYVNMSIGTAKPVFDNSKLKNQKSKLPHDNLTPDYVDSVDHYGFNIREPNDQITLAEWQQAAFAMVDYVSGQGRTPLLVGGTMLYIDSVVDNYDIPAVGPNEQLRENLEREETVKLYNKLIKNDSDAKQFIEPGNRRRIIRALEVIEATGRPFSQQRKKRPPRYEIEMIGIFPNWDVLKERIAVRAEQMMQEGLVEETRRLQGRYGKDLPLLQTMNYRQAAAVLASEMTEQEAQGEMKRVNMRYARRQMNWWKRRDSIRWFPG